MARRGTAPGPGAAAPPPPGGTGPGTGPGTGAGTGAGTGPGTGHLSALLLRVGALNYAWTNTESLLIHLIAGLAPVDKEAATIIFLTLNTTRARLDLVERLAKRPGIDTAERARILGLTGRLAREAPLRNRYNHCIYSFSPDGEISETISMRISDRKDRILMARPEREDGARLAGIAASIDRLGALNRDIWRAIGELGYPI